MTPRPRRLSRMHIIRAITAAMAMGSCGDEVVVTEDCLELDDPDAECPEGEEAREVLLLGEDSEITSVVRYSARTLEQDGETYELPAECCYEIETVQPSVQFPSHCGMGRPFVVDGRARVASQVLGARAGAWTRTRGPREPRADGLSSLDLATRTTLAARWRERALLEHASVASFARFTLDLMSLGAPASLVRASLVAGVSEVRHAELCFDLAQELDGEIASPGPLAVEGAQATSKEDLTARLFHDGCVEETLGALELADRELATTEPRIATVLRRLVVDEMKHAALAWRALAWLCRDASCRDVLRRELAIVEARFEAMEEDGGGGIDRPELGEPRARDLRDGMRRAFAEVVRPSVARLLSRETVPARSDAHVA